jgi:Fe2+ or Zn2+ uptake regulation protein
MIDVQLPPALETQLDETLARVARRNHFRVDSHWLDAIGRCAECASS